MITLPSTLFALVITANVFTVPQVTSYNDVGYQPTDVIETAIYFSSIDTCEVYADAVYNNLNDDEQVQSFDVIYECTPLPQTK